MHSDASHAEVPEQSSLVVDAGLLSPVTVGHDEALSDFAFAEALIIAEVALARAWSVVGECNEADADAIDAQFLFGEFEAEAIGVGAPVNFARLVEDAVAGGNPVIPLVKMMRAAAPEHLRAWVHRGATSQDIFDTALMKFAREAAEDLVDTLDEIDDMLADFAHAQRDTVAAARTLTQHAVPTTVGLRAAGWLRGVRRATKRLDDILHELPAQLGGAGGTLASFVELSNAEVAEQLPLIYAELLGLAAPEAPWHTVRWPVTELGDALVQVVDSLGVIAADVATLSRTEIGELAEGTGGGSSAMPQKRNPAGSVLIRSAAIRAPHLAATLHSAAALAVDERPDGAWHAEWQTLRELLRLAAGAAHNAHRLVAGLVVDTEAVARNLGLTRGLIVAERLSLALGPVIGADRVAQLVAAAGGGADLAELLRAEPGLADIDTDALLDPSAYTGLAGVLVDQIDLDSDLGIDFSALFGPDDDEDEVDNENDEPLSNRTTQE